MTETLAPELRVQWRIGADGASLTSPLSLSDLGAGLKMLFAFHTGAAAATYTGSQRRRGCIAR